MNKLKIIAIFLFVLIGFSNRNFAQTFEKICPTKTEVPCVQAKKMIESAWVINVGEELKKDEWVGIAKYMLQFGTVDENQFKSGIKLSDAAKFIKMYIGKLSPGDGGKAIGNAFEEVYGSTPTKEEFNAWLKQIEAEKAWYTTIVLAETEKLNKDSARRTITVKNVFIRAIGKGPKPEQIAKWQNKTEDFRVMLASTRNWLYTDEGKADLRDTVRRVLNFIHNKKTGQSYTPTDAEIDKYVKAFTPGKLIHKEMIEAFEAFGN